MPFADKEKAAEYRRQKGREFRARMMEQGRCYCGSARDDVSQKRCLKCREKQKENYARNHKAQEQKRNLRRGERRAKGLCLCGRQPTRWPSGKLMKWCDQCRQVRYRAAKACKERRDAKGCCTACGDTKSVADKTLCDKCLQARRDHTREKNTSLRVAVLAAYGSACKCCGETTPEFLTIDHVNSDGNKHNMKYRPWSKAKKSRTSGIAFLKDVVSSGFSDDFQILCWNCNLAKAKHGQCPHQRMKCEVPTVAEATG